MLLLSDSNTLKMKLTIELRDSNGNFVPNNELTSLEIDGYRISDNEAIKTKILPQIGVKKSTVVFDGEFNPVRARIQVIGFEEWFFLPILCFQCERPYCAEICPSGAIKRDDVTGIVKITNRLCTGCKMCTLACPFGNIAFSKEAKVAVKCELCGGEPECVLFCPTGALEFKEVDTTMLRKKISLSEKLKAIYEGIK